MRSLISLSNSEKSLLRTTAQISYCNPFSLERLELEKRALGSDYRVEHETGVTGSYSTQEFSNILAVYDRVKPTLQKLRAVISESKTTGLDQELSEQYVDVALFVLYHSYECQLRHFVESKLFAGSKAKLGVYSAFAEECKYWFAVHAQFSGAEFNSAHLFALAFQLARAYCSIYHYLIGVSAPMRKLRERLWKSIFTHDMRRYRRSTYKRMSEHSTLITGPSGTGKELVARAIGLSRYITFNAQTQSFDEDFSESFYALNLAAFPATLIESELFGHTRGAFTGAAVDRKGYFEQSGPLGTVFLDEIAEVEQPIQIKLLRILESRQFQRMGDTKVLQFKGKVIAATNRIIAEEVQHQRFRQDLYYRLCADEIVTPTLSERLRDCPNELTVLVKFLLKRWNDDAEHERTATELLTWINQNISTDYTWPGNVRELDQCLRNLVIHGGYSPSIGSNQETSLNSVIPETLLKRIASIEAPAEELVEWYCRFAYQKLQNFEEAGRRLALDRRTVRAKVL